MLAYVDECTHSRVSDKMQLQFARVRARGVGGANNVKCPADTRVRCSNAVPVRLAENDGEDGGGG